MVHEYEPHRARGERQEVRAVVPTDGIALGQAQVRLVDDRRRVQRIGRAVPRPVAVRESAQLVVDDGIEDIDALVGGRGHPG